MKIKIRAKSTGERNVRIESPRDMDIELKKMTAESRADKFKIPLTTSIPD
jgi:hypothetical protein